MGLGTSSAVLRAASKGCSHHSHRVLPAREPDTRSVCDLPSQAYIRVRSPTRGPLPRRGHRVPMRRPSRIGRAWAGNEMIDCIGKASVSLDTFGGTEETQTLREDGGCYAARVCNEPDHRDRDQWAGGRQSVVSLYEGCGHKHAS